MSVWPHTHAHVHTMGSDVFLFSSRHTLPINWCHVLERYILSSLQHKVPCAFPSTAVFLRSKPSEADLRRHVCSVVGQKWRSICMYLGIPNAKVESLLGSNPHNVEEVFFQALCYWHAGNTSEEVTWSTLLKAMKEAGLRNHVEDLLKRRPMEVATLSW